MLIVREYTPNVIEPSFGIGRILYSLLEHSYYCRPGDEQRAVFSFPVSVAPTKVLVLPISNQPEFNPIVNEVGKFFLGYSCQLVNELRKMGIANKVDISAGSIGRRYARNDELGTPFAITIDFQSVKDQTITLRERDSTQQIRSNLRNLLDVLRDLITEQKSWKQIQQEYPPFTTQSD
jgi:glycyl-tRNA synthetase